MAETTEQILGASSEEITSNPNKTGASEMQKKQVTSYYDLSAILFSWYAAISLF